MANPTGVSVIRTDLVHYGRVTRVINNTQFAASGLSGLGDGALAGYLVYVLVKNDGTTNAPHGQQQVAAAYVSPSGTITHAAFTAPLVVGDQVLLLHPNVQAGAAPTIATYPGSTLANWQAAEAVVTNIGGAATINKIHSLLLDISALAGNIDIRFYIDVNGVNVQVYTEQFNVAADGPALWVINGTLAIHDILTITAQSDAIADNGQPIGWEYVLEAA